MSPGPLLHGVVFPMQHAQPASEAEWRICVVFPVVWHTTHCRTYYRLGHIQHTSTRVGRTLAYAVLHRVVFPCCIMQHARVAFCITSGITNFIPHVRACACVPAYGIKKLDGMARGCLTRYASVCYNKNVVMKSLPKEVVTRCRKLETLNSPAFS